MNDPVSRWPIFRLGDICEIQLGKMLSPRAKAGRRPVPYLRNQNVQWGRFELSDIAQMDFSEREERKFSLRGGDVLVCEGGEPGRAAVWLAPLPRCCYQKALHRLRPKQGVELDPFYLMHRFRLGAVAGEFANSHSKTTIAHLPAVRLAALKIALPPLTEQRRILSGLDRELDAVARARAAAATMIDAAQALAISLLRDAFGAALK